MYIPCISQYCSSWRCILPHYSSNNVDISTIRTFVCICAFLNCFGFHGKKVINTNLTCIPVILVYWISSNWRHPPNSSICLWHTHTFANNFWQWLFVSYDSFPWLTAGLRGCGYYDSVKQSSLYCSSLPWCLRTFLRNKCHPLIVASDQRNMSKIWSKWFITQRVYNLVAIAMVTKFFYPHYWDWWRV